MQYTRAPPYLAQVLVEVGVAADGVLAGVLEERLLRQDVEEEAICFPKGTQHASVSHEYNDDLMAVSNAS